MKSILAVVVVMYLGGCLASDPPQDPTPGDSISQTALALYSTDGAWVIVYIAPMDLLTPENLAKMDAAELIGAPWTRVQVPASLGSFDLAGASGSSFRQELLIPHPYTEQLVPSLLDFEAGDRGLQGSIAVVDDGAALETSFDVEFKGNYTLYPDIGPRWLEFSASQSWIVADDPEAP